MIMPSPAVSFLLSRSWPLIKTAQSCYSGIPVRSNLTPVDVAISFVVAINAGDIHAIAARMTEDHRFVDSLGVETRGRERMCAGWEAYFRIVPDYQIEVRETFSRGNTIVLLGLARGTYTADGMLCQKNAWETPAAWRARVHGDQIAEWQVYADNEPVRRRMLPRCD